MKKMMLALVLLTALLLSLSLPAAAVENPDTDANVTDSTGELVLSFPNYYESHFMQAFAIYDGVIFQTYDGGRCQTYDFATGERLGGFHFGSDLASNHCGNINFGTQYPEGNTSFPAAYVSGDLTTKACYVESVTETSSELIQTIYFDIEPSTYTGGQAIIDNERGRIIYMQREIKSIGDRNNTYMMCEFPIPDLNAGAEIHYTNDDVIGEKYSLPYYPGIYQGACFKDGNVLQSYGLSGDSDVFGSRVGLVCYDGETHDFFDIMPLDDICLNEPQSVCVYEGELYVNFANGQLYRITPAVKLEASYDCTASIDGMYDWLTEQLQAKVGEGVTVTVPADTIKPNLSKEPVELRIPLDLSNPYNANKAEAVVTLTLGHTFGTYTADGNATCTVSGTKTATCTACGLTDTVIDTGAKPAHAYGAYRSNNDATCSSDGTKTATCAKCNQTNTIADTGSRLMHILDEYKPDGNATCTSDGTKTSKCLQTGCTYANTVTDTGSKLAHTYGEYSSNHDATCTSDGTKTAMCTQTGCKHTDTVTDGGSRLTHIYGAPETVKEPTVSEVGKAASECALCGDIKETELPVLPKEPAQLPVYIAVILCIASAAGAAIAYLSVSAFVLKKKVK